MSVSNLNSLLETIHIETVRILQNKPVSNAEWKAFVATAHAVHSHEDGEMKMYTTFEEDVSTAIRHAKRRLSRRKAQELVKAYIHEWKNFNTACNLLAPVIRPVPTKNQSKYDQNRDKVCRIMLNGWNNCVLSKFKQDLQQVVTQLIEKERNGEVCESQLVIAVRKSYVDLNAAQLLTVAEDEISPDLQRLLGSDEPNLILSNFGNHKLSVYRELFEKDYVANTHAFYLVKASEYLATNGVEEYIKYAYLRISGEFERGQKYLESDEASQQALTSIWGDLFVVPFKETILAQFAGMVKQNDAENLHIMYRLMSLIPDDCTAMLAKLEEPIVDVCLAEMSGNVLEDSAKYVQQLLDLFHRFNRLVDVAYLNDPRALSSRDKAFKTITNDCSQCAEFLANFCDMLLRRTQLRKKLTSGDIDGKLKDVISLIKYLGNKIVFMKFYKSHLTRRLVLETSADIEMEAEVVENMKDIGMSSDYLFRFKQMLRDVKSSRDLNHDFRRDRCNLYFSTKVFSASAWDRNNEVVPVSLPAELGRYCSDMEVFYKKQHQESRRKLIWQHQLSTGTISFANSVGKFDLEVTCFQVTVLFAWNERPHELISFGELGLATELCEAELRRTMWSLVAVGVVVCRPKVKSASELEKDTRFWINDEFGLVRNGKVEKRGKINLIGRLQLSSCRSN